MLFDDTRSVATRDERHISTARELEFAQALDHYISSYIAAQQRRLCRPAPGNPSRRLSNSLGTPATSQKRAHGTSAVRQFAALMIKALEGLGSAMSGGGRFPPVGIM